MKGEKGPPRPRLRQAGLALLSVVFIVSLLLIMGVALSRLVLFDQRGVVTQLNGMKAFYLAEAGIEKAKCEIVKDSYWYTDFPHSPPDDIYWLMKEGGAVGHQAGNGEPLGEGRFKIIKEQGKYVIYSVGYLGPDVEKSQARCIIKIKYSYPPFRQLEWRLL